MPRVLKRSHTERNEEFDPAAVVCTCKPNTKKACRCKRDAEAKFKNRQRAKKARLTYLCNRANEQELRQLAVEVETLRQQNADLMCLVQQLQRAQQT